MNSYNNKGIENHFFLCLDDANHHHQTKKMNGENAGQLQGQIWSTAAYQDDEDSEMSQNIEKCSVDFQLDEGDKIEFITKKMAIGHDTQFCSQSKIIIKGKEEENSFCSVREEVFETEADKDGKIRLEFIHEVSQFVYSTLL